MTNFSSSVAPPNVSIQYWRVREVVLDHLKVKCSYNTEHLWKKADLIHTGSPIWFCSKK